MITEESLNEFKNNLQKVSDFTADELKIAMEVAQGLVVNNAKSEHTWIKFGTPNPPGHPDKRYYAHTQQLSNSTRSGEVRADKNEIKGEVKAGDSSLTAYAAFVESGYPFFQPALDEEKDKIINLFADAVKRVIA